MTDNNILLRTTTISLDEYNKLQNEVNALRETKGALQTTIQNQCLEISKLSETQPKVKVIHGKVHHYHDDYDGNSSECFSQDSVEFVNLNEVERLAENKAKEVVKDKLDELEMDAERNKHLVKQLRENVDVVQDKVEQKDKLIKKLKVQQVEELDEKTEVYNKNLELLRKAQKEDEKEYKDTIKELKEEIQKVKDNKTDIEIEEKRNKEIKDLKLRIKDLEKMVEDLGKLNFFSRMFKLRSISTEVLAARKELVERQDAANKIGTTYVKENGKYRNYDRFKTAMNSIFGQHDIIDWLGRTYTNATAYRF